MNKINYQQIYEEDMVEHVKESLNLPGRFHEMAHEQKMFIQDLIDIGYNRAIEDALNPEVLADTAALASDMGTQLYNFANLINSYLPDNNEKDGS